MQWEFTLGPTCLSHRGQLQQCDVCAFVCVCACACGDEACGTAQDLAVSESPTGSFVAATQHPP